MALPCVQKPGLLLRVVNIPGLLRRLDDLFDMWMGKNILLNHAAKFVPRHSLLDWLLASISDSFSHQTLKETHLLLAFDDSRKQSNGT